MKSIQLTKYEKPIESRVYTSQKHYTVMLGTGHRYSFDSEKACKRFLAVSSKYFTFKAIEYNEVYIDLFRFYREAWFYMDENRGVNGYNFLQMDYKVPGYLNDLERFFARLMKDTPNRDYCIITIFESIHAIIVAFVKDFIKLYDSKAQALMIYRCEAILKRSERLQRSLTKYGSAHFEKKEAQVIKLAIA